MHVRSWLLTLWILGGCAGELSSGSATSVLGQSRYGGTYNPDLAGCKVTEVAGETGTAMVQVTYDGRGRAVGYAHEAVGTNRSEVESSWSGGCITRVRVESANGSMSLEDIDCDEHGWPVSSHYEQQLGGSGGELEPVDTTWTNTYDGDELVLVEQEGGDSTAYTWDGNRVTRTESTNTSGIVSTASYTYNDAGWVLSVDNDGTVTDYEYDGDRLLVATQGDTRTEWFYEDGERRPNRRSFFFADGAEETTQLTFDCR